jgi:hypothetical protein
MKAGHVATIRQGIHKEFFGTTSRKWLLGRPRRWKDNTKMNLKKIGYDDRKWMELNQECVSRWVTVLVVMKFQVILPGFISSFRL